MTDLSLPFFTLAASLFAALAALAGCIAVLMRGGAARDAMRQEADSLRTGLTQLDQGLRRELAVSLRDGQRAQAEELDRVGRTLREALDTALRLFGDQQSSRLEAVEKTVRNGEAMTTAVLNAFKDQVTSAGEAQRAAIDATLGGFADRLRELRQSLTTDQENLRTGLTQNQETLRESLSLAQEHLRTMVADRLDRMQQGNETKLEEMRRAIDENLRAALQAFGEQQASRLEAVETTVKNGDIIMQAVLNAFKEQVNSAGEAQRAAIDATLVGFAERLRDLRESVTKDQENLRATLTQSQEILRESLRLEQEGLRTMVADRLDKMQQGNEAKLEEMRKAVDEKLQTALEKQLRDSFTNLQEQLSAVQQAIGQVQSVAGEVGDLKRLFSNVKSRGGWGEAQLEAMLADIMPAGTYEKNFRVKEGGTELVEFALRVPGRGDEAVWLAIDSKFPTEDYARLVAANEAGNREDEARARASLERTIRVQARKISDKYIEAPRTLDFAVLYLPSDSLFAEIARAPGLIEALRRETRVMVSGPSLLPAFLHTFRVGYLSLQLEQKVTEIGETLGAVKVEWGKFGDSLTKIQTQAEKLSSGIGETLRRQRAVGRKLRGVDALEDSRATLVLGLDVGLEEVGDEE